MEVILTKKQVESLLEQFMGKPPVKSENGFLTFGQYDNSLSSAVSMIKKHEGFCDGMRKCPPYTIGYGTRTDLHPELKGKKIDENIATAYVKKDLEQTILPAIKKHVKIPLQENELAALISLIYNIGPGNFQKSQLLKDLNKKNMEGVKKNWENFALYNGKKLRGLVNRRMDEIRLFFDGK